MKRDRIFARTGIRWIQLSALAAVVLYMSLGVYGSIAAVIVMLWLMRYYYDPERELPSHPLGVMSPVDGTIEEARAYFDPFLDRNAIRIRMRANLFRTYHERSPTEGKLVEYWPLAIKRGTGYNNSAKASGWWIQTDEEDNVLMIVTSHPAWLRSECHVQAGERVGQGRRCGHFPMISRVDIFVDENAFLKVEAGQAVQAGIDTLATFNHDAQNTDESES